jgi:hypothetical protein
MKELCADRYETIETAELFSTGRRKYDVIFLSDVEGVECQMSRHLGMRLVNRSGHPYFVCQRTPKAITDIPWHITSPSYSPSPMSPTPRSSHLEEKVSICLQTPRPMCISCKRSCACAPFVAVPPYTTTRAKNPQLPLLDRAYKICWANWEEHCVSPCGLPRNCGCVNS